MGHIQLKLVHLDSAIEYFRQSLKMSEKEFFFINDSLGIVYFYKNEFDSAIKYIEEAWSFSDKNFYFHFHLGLYNEAILHKRLDEKNSFDEKNQLMEIEDLKKKIKDSYTSALKINPNAYNVLLNIGSIYASEGSSATAENYYKQALNINENDWKININLAFLYMKEKEYDASIDFFEDRKSVV